MAEPRLDGMEVVRILGVRTPEQLRLLVVAANFPPPLVDGALRRWDASAVYEWVERNPLRPPVAVTEL